MRRVTLTQLKVFVLVARLGSVKAAAVALGVSEPAVSQALTALRQSLGDPLLVRSGSAMELTSAGTRVVGIASQIVNLAFDAEAAVRQSQGAPELVRVVATSTIATTVAPPLLESFSTRAGAVEVSLGTASTQEMAALVLERLADVALGPDLAGSHPDRLESVPLARYRLSLVATPARLGGPGAPAWERLARERWLVDPSVADPHSDTGRLLSLLRPPDTAVRVFPTALEAWSAAGAGEGVAPAVEHLVAPHLSRLGLVSVPVPGGPVERMWHVTTLTGDRRPPVVARLRRFLATPEAMQVMRRAHGGVPAARFRPPVYVTLWS